MVLEVAEPIKGYLKKTHEGLKFQKTVVVGEGRRSDGGGSMRIFLANFSATRGNPA